MRTSYTIYHSCPSLPNSDSSKIRGPFFSYHSCVYVSLYGGVYNPLILLGIAHMYRCSGLSCGSWRNWFFCSQQTFANCSSKSRWGTLWISFCLHWHFNWCQNVGLVQATLLLRFYGCDFLVISGGYYLVAVGTILWIIPSFCFLVGSSPWFLCLGVAWQL